MAILYHGSSVGGLSALRPALSEHGVPYVYVSPNPVVAAFYTVHCVERPYNWFPYGLEDGLPVYPEYYPDALADVYGGKRGYLYRCEDPGALENPTAISQALVCREPLPVSGVEEIPDMYAWFLRRQQAGNLRIIPFSHLSEKQLAYRDRMIKEEIALHHLKDHPETGYARFLRSRFPSLWEDGLSR